MRIFLLILFSFHFFGGIETEEATLKTKTKEYCIISKLWNCTFNSVELDDVPEYFEDYGKGNNFRTDFDIQFAYQIPVDSNSGDLFVSSMIKWNLDKQLIKEKNVSFFIKIDELNSGDTVESKFIKIEAERKNWTKKALIYPKSLFTLSLEKRFDIGKDYRLTILYRTVLPEKKELILLSTKAIQIAGFQNTEENFTCSSAHINITKKVAGRWTTGIKTIIYSILEQVNVAFFAAPKVFCIDQYEVKIFEIIMGKEHLVDTVIVEEEDLIQTGMNFVGNVTFKGLKQSSNYSIKVKAVEYHKDSSSCLCRVSSSCDCVSASTEPFQIPNTETFIDTKYSEANVPFSKLDFIEKDPLRELRSYISIIILGIIILLICLILFCGFYRRREGEKSKNGTRVFLKIWKNEKMDITPLIKNQENLSLFILNPDESKDHFMSNFVDVLKSHNINVNYPPLDINQVEENIVHYVYNSIGKADRVLFFHNEKSHFLIRGMRPPNEGRFDELYSIVLSMVSVNNPKMIHIRFTDDGVAREPFAETFLEFPRDMKYLVDSLGIQVNEEVLEEVKASLETSPEEVKIDSQNPSEDMELDLQKSSKDWDRLPESSEIETNSDSVRSLSIEEYGTSECPSPRILELNSESKTGISIQSLDSGVHTGEICA
ncbi:hypothetical protein FO519_007117 [Halicephalobus sp. NKZ332]|nr:hypothetical protein FO519_007117 [Halicephalobus sp. NKZ332]